MAAALSLGSAVAGAQVPRRAAPAAEASFDVLDYRMFVQVPDTGTSLRMSATLTVRRTSGARTLPLDFVGMQVDDVRTVGAGASASDSRAAAFTRDERSLRVSLPATTRAVDTLLVTVGYHGSPVNGMLLSADSSKRWRAYADNWPDRARYWIPSIDRPDDKATVSWTVETRLDTHRDVVANGALEQVDSAGLNAISPTVYPPPQRGPDRKWTQWREAHPIPTYLMVVAVAPLVRRDLVTCDSAAPRGGCVPQAVLVAPEVESFLPGPFARAPEMVAYFASLVGPFPYEKLWHVQSSTQFGGMENASAIFYADAPFRSRTMGDAVVAHETAHQWFGDAVTERTFADLWLSEGFATYFAALWAGHAHGDSAFRAELARTRAQVVASPASRTRPVRDIAQTDYMQLLNTNSYQKGGWVLHMLRGEVGDSAFFRGIRAYYAAHRDGNATSADLRSAMERASGRKLGWYFDQWLTRPGVPTFTVDRVAGATGGDATYEVRQTSPQPYAFPLTVAERSSGRRSTVRVAARRVTRVRLPAGVLDIDPDVALLWAAPAASPVTAP